MILRMGTSIRAVWMERVVINRSFIIEVRCLGMAGAIERTVREMYIEYIKELVQCLESTRAYSQDGMAYGGYEDAMRGIVGLFSEIKKQRKQVFFIGNGGSAAIASHMTVDFMKNGGMNTYNLYDSSVITCMGNDYGYENIFSVPLGFLGKKGDLLVAISSSGNSQNIVNAIQAARDKQMLVMTFSGFGRDNRIIHRGDCNVYVPACHYGIVESIHNLILQQAVDSVFGCSGENDSCSYQ